MPHLSMPERLYSIKNMKNAEINQLKRISDFLNSISHKMTEDLKSVRSGDLGLINPDDKSKIQFVDFGINEDGYTIFLHPMDSENNQLGYKKLLLDYPNGFLRDEGLDLNTDGYDLDDEDVLDRLDEFDAALKSEFTKWFSECWDKADGVNAEHKFYFVSHDDDRSFDLSSKKWISHYE